MFGFFGKFALTSFFKDGLLYKVKPDIGNLYDNRDKFYNTKYIVVDGEKYDIENEKSISSIVAPRFSPFSNTPLGITGNLVYILRMKASNLKREGKTNAALALLKKATEMMPVSEVAWQKKDYLLYADWLFELGKEHEGQKASQCIEKLLSEMQNSRKSIIEQTASHTTDSFENDLVEASFFYGCCAECSKYRGRWFSRTGKDPRFPKKPRIKNCTCSGIDFSPVIFGLSSPIVNSFLDHKVDIIEYSNRPFAEERTDKEKAMYDNSQKEKEITEWFEPYRIKLLSYKHKSEVEYDWICKNLPEIAPKSISGYNRMKNSNSNNYQILAEEAEKQGYNIRFSQEEEKEYAFLKECRSKYNRVIGECMAFRKSL